MRNKVDGANRIKFAKQKHKVIKKPYRETQFDIKQESKIQSRAYRRSLCSYL